VLLDLTMPGLDGAEVLREIRAVNADVRVLLMSGYSEQDVLKRLKGQGRVAFLHKPFTQETLLPGFARCPRFRKPAGVQAGGNAGGGLI